MSPAWRDSTDVRRLVLDWADRSLRPVRRAVAPGRRPDGPRERRRVLCVVPRGLDGRGGIERLFQYVEKSDAFAATGDLELRYFTSRGDAVGNAWMLSFPYRLAQYVRILAREEVDLVHINLSVRASSYRKILLFHLARLFRKPVLVHFHGGGFEHMLDQSRSTGFILRMIASADRAVVLGRFWRAVLGPAAGIANERLDVVYNGIPDFAGSEAARPVVSADDPLRILFAGEVGTRKGVDVLIEALGQLDRRYRNWHCIIAGNGELEPYRRAAAALGIASKVDFRGWVSSATIHELMLESDVVILPSRAEALPVSLIEGACAGAALVATNEGATAEIVEDGVNGRLVPLDAEAIADVLAGLGEDRLSLIRMRVAARNTYAAAFTVEHMAEGLATIYRQMIARRYGWRPGARR